MSVRIAVVGGGVIGLSVAWQAAAAGHDVVLVDPDVGRGASWVAGGMLAPVTEATPGEEDVLALGEASLRMWPEFADALTRDAFEPSLSTAGTVVAAVDSADVAELERLAGYLARVGRDVEQAPRRRLPIDGLSASVRSGLIVPSDLAVDNRRLLDALHEACRRRGVEFVARQANTVTPSTVDTDGSTVEADVVVLSAGARTGRLHPALATAIRPLKGEILRVRAGGRCLPPPSMTLRARVQGRPIYLVPRASGEVVVGATQYEATDTAPKAAGIRQLLEDAEQIFPAIGEYELVETRAGLRAASPDNLPLIGPLNNGVLVASGHYRNGLLMAPVTAAAIVALISGNAVPDVVAPAHPNRLKEAA